MGSPPNDLFLSFATASLLACVTSTVLSFSVTYEEHSRMVQLRTLAIPAPLRGEITVPIETMSTFLTAVQCNL